MQKPNPCPFCGSTQLVVYQSVHCGNCACVGPQASSVDEAIHKWNQRSPVFRHTAPFHDGDRQLTSRDTDSLVGRE
jgi:hypothetical protein